jgi:1-acyl-sn-glycerol-3-phosphate acyltransferase
VGGDLNAWWRVGVPLAVGLERLLFRVRVAGIHRVPLAGPAILAFNHVSVLDGPCLAIETAWRRRRVTRFLVAAEVFRHPVSGWFLRTYRQIPIRRGAGDARALDDALATIRRGALAAIAPEGAVNPVPGELQRVRTGVARLALPTGAPVIPVGVWGTHRRWPRSGPRLSRPLRPCLGIAFGDPIEPTGEMDRQEDVDAFADAVRRRLEEQLAEARVLAVDP